MNCMQAIARRRGIAAIAAAICAVRGAGAAARRGAGQDAAAAQLVPPGRPFADLPGDEEGLLQGRGHRPDGAARQRLGRQRQEDRPRPVRRRHLRCAHRAHRDQQGREPEDGGGGVRQGRQQRVLPQEREHQDAEGPGRQEDRRAAGRFAPRAVAGVRRDQRHRPERGHAGQRQARGQAGDRRGRRGRRARSTSTPATRSGRRCSARATSATCCGPTSGCRSTATPISSTTRRSRRTRS